MNSKPLHPSPDMCSSGVGVPGLKENTDTPSRRSLDTHRLHSSSFLGLPYWILNMNQEKELLWSL